MARVEGGFTGLKRARRLSQDHANGCAGLAVYLQAGGAGAQQHSHADQIPNMVHGMASAGGAAAPALRLRMSLVVVELVVVERLSSWTQCIQRIK